MSKKQPLGRSFLDVDDLVAQQELRRHEEEKRRSASTGLEWLRSREDRATTFKKMVWRVDCKK